MPRTGRVMEVLEVKVVLEKAVPEVKGALVLGMLCSSQHNHHSSPQDHHNIECLRKASQVLGQHKDIQRLTTFFPTSS